jgi:hypothetical protein
VRFGNIDSRCGAATFITLLMALLSLVRSNRILAGRYQLDETSMLMAFVGVLLN